MRQTKRWRAAFLEAILRQDIGWFDVSNPSELTSRIGECVCPSFTAQRRRLRLLSCLCTVTETVVSSALVLRAGPLSAWRWGWARRWRRGCSSAARRWPDSCWRSRTSPCSRWCSSRPRPSSRCAARSSTASPPAAPRASKRPTAAYVGCTSHPPPSTLLSAPPSREGGHATADAEGEAAGERQDIYVHSADGGNIGEQVDREIAS